MTQAFWRPYTLNPKPRAQLLEAHAWAGGAAASAARLARDTTVATATAKAARCAAYLRRSLFGLVGPGFVRFYVDEVVL